MNNKIIALIIVFLFLNSNFSVAQLTPLTPNIDDFTGREETGESLIIEVVNQEPPIVTANVLNDQNVPVYFNLKAISLGGIFGINDVEVAPFYGTPEVERVDIRPKGESVRYFAGYSHIPPKKARFLEEDLIEALDVGDSINLGTLIISLKRIEKENEIPNRIDLDFEAILDFKLENNFLGIGKQVISVKEFKNEEEWKESFDKKGFWGNTIYVRAEDIENEKVKIIVYDSEFRRINTLTLDKGKESGVMRLINQPSLANSFFRIKLVDIKKTGNKAVIKVKVEGEEEIREIYEGDPIYGGSGWKIKKIILQGINKGIIISKKGFEDKEIYLTGFFGVSLHDYINHEGAYSWAVTSEGVKIKEKDNEIEVAVSNVDKGCVNRVYKEYEPYIKGASIKYGVPISLIISTICTESGGNPNAINEEEGYKNLAQTPSKIDIGLMQTLFSTARKVYDGDPRDITLDSLKNPKISINVGTKYISDQYSKTDFDPVKVAAAYNHGKLSKTKENKWGLVSTGNHIDRFVGYYNQFINSNLNIPEVEVSKAYECEEGDYLELDEIDENTNSEKIYCTTIKQLSEFIKIKPNSVYVNDAYFVIGNSYEGLGDKHSALDYYRKVKSGGYYIQALQKILDIEEGIDDKLSTYYIEDENVIISLRNIEKGIEEDEVGISINGGAIEYYLLGKSINDNYYIKEFDDNYLIIDKKDDKEFEDVRISFGKSKSVEGFVVSYKDFVTYKEASIEALPGTGKARSKSDFSVHIPIEDYGIKFSDEQIDAQINWTEKTIESMSKFISKLDNIIQFGNKLCWGFWSLFTIRNFFISSSAKRARALVNHGFDGKSGVYDFCSRHIRSGYQLEQLPEDMRSKYYSNFDECIYKNKEIINELTKTVKNSYEETASKRKSGVYSGEVGKYMSFKINGKKIVFEDSLITSVDFENQDRLDIIDKKIEELENLKEFPIYKDFKNNLQKEYEDINNEIKAKQEAYNATTKLLNSEDVKNSGLDENDLRSLFDKYYFDIYQERIFDLTGLYEKDPELENFGNQEGREVLYETVISKNSEDFIFVKEEDKSKKKLLLPLTKKIMEEDLNLKLGVRDDGGVYDKFGRRVYYYKDNISHLVVNPVTDYFGKEIRKDYAPGAKNQYYENGRPYCIATGNGNFVEVLEFYNSGDPKTVRERNVGRDGLLCTEDDVSITHPSLLYDNSIQDMRVKRGQLEREVNRAGICKPGETKELTISGLSRKLGCEHVAARLQKNLDIQCTDVFSIGECQILFNVCDPVMCPVSRFNLGGRYPVDNVVQTGLIGSLVLGLPNWAARIPGISKGSGTAQIIPPICLTGVSSSAKSYRSMLEGYNECLKISKEQNKNVGICEKIRSVFWCELAWREASSIGKALLKSKKGTDLIGYIRGSGGGEYSSLQSQASYIGDSAEFFTENYAKTAFAAYKARSTEEIGSEICKNFFGAKGPEFGKFFDQLTKPESPPQFTAFFDVKPWTTEAGVTKLSRDPMFLGEINEQNLYSVYYHIYAGEDQDIRYSVYLRDPLERKLFVSGGRVGRNYDTIKKGGYADHNIDVIASAGYNEICIWINGRTECGFGRATSSFILNRISDNLVEGQLDKQIDSEQECYSQYTGPGFDVGKGIDIALPSDFGQRAGGVKRYCSIGVPGGDNSKYQKVGSCGKDEQGRSLGDCWIDLESVKESLHSLDKIEEVRYKQFNVSRYKINLIYETLISDFNKLKNEFNEVNKNERNEFLEFRKRISRFIIFHDQDTYLKKANDDSPERYSEVSFTDIFYYAYDTKEAEKSFGNMIEIFEMLIKTAELIKEAPNVKPLGIVPEEIEKITIDPSKFKYKLELISISSAVPSIWFEWDGSSWTKESTEIIPADRYRYTIPKKENLGSNYNEVLINIKNYIIKNNFRELKLYCKDNENVYDSLINLDKVSESVKNTIDFWVNLGAKECEQIIEKIEEDKKPEKKSSPIFLYEITLEFKDNSLFRFGWIPGVNKFREEKIAWDGNNWFIYNKNEGSYFVVDESNREFKIGSRSVLLFNQPEELRHSALEYLGLFCTTQRNICNEIGFSCLRDKNIKKISTDNFNGDIRELISNLENSCLNPEV